MLEPAGRGGVKFNYGTQRRYVAMYRNVRRLIDEGRSGSGAGHRGQLRPGAAQWGHTHAADMLLFLPATARSTSCRARPWPRTRTGWACGSPRTPPITCGYVRFRNGIHAYLSRPAGTNSR